MALWNWFTGLFDKDSNTLSLSGYAGELNAEVFYKQLAINAGINLISNAVSRSEFLTYEKGKEVKSNNYYLFNVEPNQNKTSSKFWRDVVHKLVYENECLVVQQNDMFYVADSFEIIKFAFKENLYREIIVEEYKLNNTYKESEVFHFELHNEKIKTLIEGLNMSYSKLIAASMNHYKKSNAKRGTLKIPTSYGQTETAQKDLEDLFKNKFKRFFEAENGAVLPLTNGLEYEELETDKSKKGSASGSEIRPFINDIFDFVAIALQIPPQLLKGNIADTSKVVDDLLTFCINPLVELIADEINRKYYGKKNYLEKTYVKIDTSKIKNVNIKDIASSLDILFRIGANSLNDNLRALDREEINEDWANERYVTKNYMSIVQASKESNE